MPKKRNPENKGLPARWRFQRGAYFYRVPPGKEAMWDGKQDFRLGKTLPEAYREWAKRAEAAKDVRTIGKLLDQYALEVVPTKAIRTQHGNNKHIPMIRKVFGHMQLASIKPHMVYGYFRERTSKTCARQEIGVLSHAFTKAVEWGYIDRHPFKGQVRLEDTHKPRTRYVEDWEIVEALSIPSPSEKGGVAMVKAYVRLKLLTAMRETDLLSLREADLRDDGIHVTPSKTKNSSGERRIIEWSDAVREAIAMARAARPVDISPFLFCTRDGKSYFNLKTGKPEGWASLWRRFMNRVLKETELKERFAERDLRAKASSDAETLEWAQQLLAHTDSRTTKRFYRRKATKVKPLR